jgi:UDP-N-acetylglucosamine 2-epimerase
VPDVLFVLGTRPEAIKLAPVILEARRRKRIAVRVCVTGQHREMLDQVLELFAIVPDTDLALMLPEQALAPLTAQVIQGMDEVLEREKPSMVIVQGDTTTIMATAMAAFYRGIPVGHVEAGLRSNNIRSPFPEEMNRRFATLVSGVHFAPSRRAVDALLGEGVDSSKVYLTGNPVIDALRMISDRPPEAEARALLGRCGLSRGGATVRSILVTAHRRENFGAPFESICRGLKGLADRNPDICLIYPVHLNPLVQEPARRILANHQRIHLLDPVDYETLVHLMEAVDIVLTDSGGIQEEAPALGKPVLVLRTETERPEGIEAGTARLVGPSEEAIVAETERLLRDKDHYANMAKAVNPYGDGRAAERIADAVERELLEMGEPGGR